MEGYYSAIASNLNARLEVSRNIKRHPGHFDAVVVARMRSCLEGANRADQRKLADASFARGMKALRARDWGEAKVSAHEQSQGQRD